jgi:subtilisin family serine protease
MFSKALITLVAAALLAPAANAGTTHYSVNGTTTLATPFISPPPKLDRPMRWVHRQQPLRALQGIEAGTPVVVGLDSMSDLPALRARYALEDVFAIPGLHAVEIGGGRLTELAQDARVRYVQTRGPKRHLLHLRNDPLLSPVGSADAYVREPLRQLDLDKLAPMFDAPYEWQFGAAHVDRALNISRGSPNILACTVDTGSGDIPDLAGKVDGRYAIDGLSPLDDVGHGTIVASLIAANVDDGFGMAGFGGSTHLISFHTYLDDTAIGIGIDKLRSLGCRIINISIGGEEPTSPILRDAMTRALVAGVLIVAAAGNDGADAVSYPAADLQPPNGADSLGLAVGASDFAGNPSKFSNRGANLSLLAPGDYDYGCTGILAALPPKSSMYDDTCFPVFDGSGGARYAYVGGTSFSSPEVAGVAALVWAARPGLRNFEVADIIKRSAHRETGGWTPTAGYGVLDAAAALEMATGRSSADAVKIDGLRIKALRKQLTATGAAKWNDGSALRTATVACAGASAATFADGTFACTWRFASAKARATFRGRVDVTDPESGLSASADVSG